MHDFLPSTLKEANCWLFQDFHHETSYLLLLLCVISVFTTVDLSQRTHTQIRVQTQGQPLVNLLCLMRVTCDTHQNALCTIIINSIVT